MENCEGVIKGGHSLLSLNPELLLHDGDVVPRELNMRPISGCELVLARVSLSAHPTV